MPALDFSDIIRIRNPVHPDTGELLFYPAELEEIKAFFFKALADSSVDAPTLPALFLATMQRGKLLHGSGTFPTESPGYVYIEPFFPHVSLIDWHDQDNHTVGAWYDADCTMFIALGLGMQPALNISTEFTAEMFDAMKARLANEGIQSLLEQNPHTRRAVAEEGRHVVDHPIVPEGETFIVWKHPSAFTSGNPTIVNACARDYDIRIYLSRLMGVLGEGMVTLQPDHTFAFGPIDEAVIKNELAWVEEKLRPWAASMPEDVRDYLRLLTGQPQLVDRFCQAQGSDFACVEAYATLCVAVLQATAPSHPSLAPLQEWIERGSPLIAMSYAYYYFKISGEIEGNGVDIFPYGEAYKKAAADHPDGLSVYQMLSTEAAVRMGLTRTVKGIPDEVTVLFQPHLLLEVRRAEEPYYQQQLAAVSQEITQLEQQARQRTNPGE